MIHIEAIADFLSADFTIIGTTRLFHNQGSKIVLDDETSVDVYDNCKISVCGIPSLLLADALKDLELQTEGIIQVVPELCAGSHASEVLPRAS